jgi:hypothetical protein
MSVASSIGCIQRALALVRRRRPLRTVREGPTASILSLDCTLAAFAQRVAGYLVARSATRGEAVEPARIRVTLENSAGGSISLLGTESGLASAVMRLERQGWTVVDTEMPEDAGRFSASPSPLAPHRSVA